MRCTPSLFLLLASAALAPTVAAAQVVPVERDGEVLVVLETPLGRIDLAIDTVAAPVTGANFLRYVDAGLYGGGTFYRVVTPDNQPDDEVRIEVIQGGMNRALRDEAFAPILLESTSTTGLHHLDGTLSMARGDPDSARAEFFICIGDQPELDEGGARNADGRGFAAFGRVIGGMDIVRAIQAHPAEGQYLIDRVPIVAAVRGGAS
ncbi:peptidylprolyl isomerase [Gaopeijia maritima]|uniref:peptidylprolyl isomerase n=1 Tax=Gaopeijia maritima TaxID=3119007 RepID=A0ABU9E5X4_9BACT